MALNSSGTLSMGGNVLGESINLELNRAPDAALSLNDTSVRILADKYGSQDSVGFNDLHGKAWKVAYIGITNFNREPDDNFILTLKDNSSNITYELDGAVNFSSTNGTQTTYIWMTEGDDYSRFISDPLAISPLRRYGNNPVFEGNWTLLNLPYGRPGHTSYTLTMVNTFNRNLGNSFQIVFATYRPGYTPVFVEELVISSSPTGVNYTFTITWPLAP